MKAEDRIAKIEEFVHLQRYLHGLKFHVLQKGEDDFIIEFATASERQLATLRHRIRLNEMYHIRCRAIETVPFAPKKKHHGKRN